VSAREMDKRDIREVQQHYVNAAKWARDVGFDVITMLMGYSADLNHQFLIPFFNRRTDEYGGSFENRARFAQEILVRLREEVGDDCAITVRFGPDTLDAPHGLGDAGIRVDGDGGAFVELCDELVDAWDVVSGWMEWGEGTGPSRTHPTNWQFEIVKKVKQLTKKPVITVGRFTDADLMARLVREGHLDFIGAARPSIADPFLPKKIEEGRLDEIRECIGCNICIARFEGGGLPVTCTQNATAGEEYRRGWHPERFERAANAESDVLVVGAGPAGMECARVLAARGMRRVHLVDRDDEVGGSMRWISRLPGLGEWARVVQYRQIQLAKAKNVDVILNTSLDLDGILNYGADIVIMATGAYWSPDGFNPGNASIPGADAATMSHVLTPEQVMAGKAVGDKVVVFDTDGYFVGVGMAEKLANEGRTVTLATTSSSLAPYTERTLESPRLNRKLREMGIEILTATSITSVEPGRVKAASVWAEGTTDIACDSLVLATQRLPQDELYRALVADPEALKTNGIVAVYRIGDCDVPRLISEAIFSAHRLAREIDSGNPQTPLPYIRERRLVNSTEEDYELDSPAIRPPQPLVVQ
jgi:dimethylamine/trimethylamine dehydrogenase